jgi:hypothetical protein
MKLKRSVKIIRELQLVQQFVTIVAPVLAFAVIILAGMMIAPTGGRADGNFDPGRVATGFAIAPVKLTYKPEDQDYVGFGSWLVNAVADCNGCHNGGTPPNFNYAIGGNPYFNQPKKVDPNVYLSGGQDFGQVAIDANFNLTGPHIISRNLTPDWTGRPEGGNTFEQFLQIIQHGTDLDVLHPPCSAQPANPNCLFALPGINPVDGYLLQVMPWPVFNNMSQQDLLAIYKYLSAIPCITGPATASDLPPASQYAFKALHNDCTKPNDGGKDR